MNTTMCSMSFSVEPDGATLASAALAVADSPSKAATPPTSAAPPCKKRRRLIVPIVGHYDAEVNSG